MEGNRIGLAFVGLGKFSRVLADAVRHVDSARIVNCFTRTAATREAFAADYGCRSSSSLDEVLGDPEVDGLVVVTPHSTHARIIGEAASAGKHVFVEKPLTLRVEDAKAALRACEAAGVVLQVGHHRRRQAATRRIKEMIDAGKLGKLHQLEANLSVPGGGGPAQGWRNDRAECPVGGMTGLGVHMVDNLHYFAGPMKRLCAMSRKLDGEGNLDDVTSVVFEFESGVLGYIGTGYGIPKIFFTQVYGTEASAWSEEEGNRLYVQKKGESSRSGVALKPINPYADELAEFAHCVRTGGRPETGGPEGMEVVAVLEAIIESVNSSKVVEVDDFR